MNWSDRLKVGIKKWRYPYEHNHKLHRDKVAIITGAAQGIGAASALEFAETGAKVIVTDILSGVEDVAKKIVQQGGGCQSLCNRYQYTWKL